MITRYNRYGEAAKLKFGKAYNTLGNIYEKGIGVQKDDKKAYEYYKNGADLGEISCYTNLGKILILSSQIESINQLIHYIFI